MGIGSTGEQGPVTPHAPHESAAFRNWMDARLDFRRTVPLRKAYVVASSYRCGSTYLCAELWRTGVLGAPGEYLNVGKGRMLRDVMMTRLQAVSPEDYLTRLLAHRTSSNGVFGLKAHFHHFESGLHWCPELLERLSPLTFVYISRRDTLGQAVSMAKAMQTGAWTSMDNAPETPIRYDQDLIVGCLDEIKRQRLGWLRWFELHHVTPFFVTYEDLLADTPRTIRSVVELMDVQDDEPDDIRPALVGKQGDAVNLAWAARIRRDLFVADAPGPPSLDPCPTAD